jgi:hypothetical protein
MKNALRSGIAGLSALIATSAFGSLIPAARAGVLTQDVGVNGSQVQITSDANFHYLDFSIAGIAGANTDKANVFVEDLATQLGALPHNSIYANNQAIMDAYFSVGIEGDGTGLSNSDSVNGGWAGAYVISPGVGANAEFTHAPFGDETWTPGKFLDFRITVANAGLDVNGDGDLDDLYEGIISFDSGRIEDMWNVQSSAVNTFQAQGNPLCFKGNIYEVDAGHTFSYQLDSNVTYNIVSAPEGVSITNTNMLTWDVPNVVPSGTEDIVLRPESEIGVNSDNSEVEEIRIPLHIYGEVFPKISYDGTNCYMRINNAVVNKIYTPEFTTELSTTGVPTEWDSLPGVTATDGILNINLGKPGNERIYYRVRRD